MIFFYNIDKFVETLKSNDFKKIQHAMSSIVYYGDKIIDKKTKIGFVADNVCSMNLETLALVLPIYGIKYKDGLTSPLYITAVGCSEQVFGFISSYYSVDKETRMMAYKEALKSNKVNILKKIRDISPKNLLALREYANRSKSVNQATKDFVTSDYRKTRSKKDTSPEDFLKQKLKEKIKKDIKLTSDLKKKWKFKLKIKQ
jgi:hypothetical protein